VGGFGGGVGVVGGKPEGVVTDWANQVTSRFLLHGVLEGVVLLRKRSAFYQF